MKKKHLVLMSLCVLLSAVSCNQVDESYSCNPDIDHWIKNNIVMIRSLDYEEWQNLDISVRLNAYTAFTSEQKMHMWKEKIHQIKHLGWSLEELSHIEKAELFFNSHASEWFSVEKINDEQECELEKFFILWMDEGIESFGWAKNVPLLMFMTLEPLVRIKDELTIKQEELRLSVATLQTSYESSCNCHVGFGDFCLTDGPCIETDCNIKPYCGWLLLQECNGRCEAFEF